MRDGEYAGKGRAPVCRVGSVIVVIGLAGSGGCVGGGMHVPDCIVEGAGLAVDAQEGQAEERCSGARCQPSETSTCVLRESRWKWWVSRGAALGIRGRIVGSPGRGILMARHGALSDRTEVVRVEWAKGGAVAEAVRASGGEAISPESVERRSHAVPSQVVEKELADCVDGAFAWPSMLTNAFILDGETWVVEVADGRRRMAFVWNRETASAPGPVRESLARCKSVLGSLGWEWRDDGP